MIADKKTFDVEIAGISFKLKSSLDEQTVNRLVVIVNGQISQCLKSSKNGSVQNAAVLACLNLTEELMSLKKQTYQEIDSMEHRILELSSVLESI